MAILRISIGIGPEKGASERRKSDQTHSSLSGKPRDRSIVRRDIMDGYRGQAERAVVLRGKISKNGSKPQAQSIISLLFVPFYIRVPPHALI
jgi:hypothetical protein